jgi:hypothetical protein
MMGPRNFIPASALPTPGGPRWVYPNTRYPQDLGTRKPEGQGIRAPLSGLTGSGPASTDISDTTEARLPRYQDLPRDTENP